jgi:hypothetical protein
MSFCLFVVFGMVLSTSDTKKTNTNEIKELLSHRRRLGLSPDTGSCGNKGACCEKPSENLINQCFHLKALYGSNDATRSHEHNCKLLYAFPEHESVTFSGCHNVVSDSDDTDRAYICKDRSDLNRFLIRYQAYGENYGRTCAIFFAGTNSKSDVFNDAFLLGVSFEGKYTIPAGFRNEFNSIGPKAIRAAYEIGCFQTYNDIYFAGYSLGGAIAQLAAVYTQKYYGHINANLKYHVITFGGPPVFKGDVYHNFEYDHHAFITGTVQTGTFDSVLFTDFAWEWPHSAGYRYAKTNLHTTWLCEIEAGVEQYDPHTDTRRKLTEPMFLARNEITCENDFWDVKKGLKWAFPSGLWTQIHSGNYYERIMKADFGPCM